MHTRLLPVLGYCLDKIWGMFRPPFAPQSHNAGLTLIGIAVMTFAAIPANASILWDWNYSGSGITASGTFTTGDTPDANGAYLITDITGTRNSETITALQPPGTSIPGNEPFLVDDLVFPGPGPQLTKGGFGFSTSGGNYSNPFYADFLPTPSYLEFFSTPPFTNGTPGPEDTELPVQFTATSAVLAPEPASCAPVFCGLAFITLRCLRSRARKV
jgi:hypothetical protein